LVTRREVRKERAMQKIVTNLWFDTEAEEAANFYISAFSDRPGFPSEGKSEIVNISHYGEAGPREAGMVLTVDFLLEGQRFTAINGGPEFPFTEAISLLVNCDVQEEVDYFWERLASDGGEEGVCGWLKDRYGLSWQVIPTGMEEMLNDPDQEKSQRAMKAMLGMKKIDLAEVRRAYEGG
jgi:predicted 3-demethylubiquinone-9 3-methyltransferase (glyoxalase superfamily)